MEHSSLLRIACVRDAFAWATAQKPMEPSSEYYCPTRDILAARLEHCRSDAIRLGMPERQSYLLRALLGEIGGNCFDHNLGTWEDVPGALFRWKQVRHEFFAVIADRGQGIRTTLTRVRPSISTHEEALRVAFLEQLSGRAPERRGNGLKFVRSVLLSDGIDLLFQSGDAIYRIEHGNEKWEPTVCPVRGCFSVLSWKP